MSIEDAKNLEFRVSVGGVAFDVPVNYHHQDYELLRQWPRPPDGQLEGRERTPVDYIRIYALLPDMAGYTESNAREFDTPGWGRKVGISMTHRQRIIWKYYFENTAPRLRPDPESRQVPGMIHFIDTTGQDIYLSHDHPNKDIVRIICDLDSAAPSPACQVDTKYGEKAFELTYNFSLQYLSRWREIDHSIKALLDRFAQSAKNHP